MILSQNNLAMIIFFLYELHVHLLCYETRDVQTNEINVNWILAPFLIVL